MKSFRIKIRKSSSPAVYKIICLPSEYCISENLGEKFSHNDILSVSYQVLSGLEYQLLICEITIRVNSIEYTLGELEGLFGEYCVATFDSGLLSEAWGVFHYCVLTDPIAPHYFIYESCGDRCLITDIDGWLFCIGDTLAPGNSPLQELFRIDISVAKIEKLYREYTRSIASQLQRTQSHMIRDCTEILGGTFAKSGNSLHQIARWELLLDEINFALRFDYENAVSHIENMKIRSKEIRFISARIFIKRLEKCEYIAYIFSKSLERNMLIQSTILKNTKNYILEQREQQLALNESKKISHLKNFKDLAGIIAAGEICVVGCVEGTKFLGIGGKLGEFFTSPSLLRFVAVMVILFGYMFWYFFHLFFPGK